MNRKEMFKAWLRQQTKKGGKPFLSFNKYPGYMKTNTMELVIPEKIFYQINSKGVLDTLYERLSNYHQITLQALLGNQDLYKTKRKTQQDYTSAFNKYLDFFDQKINDKEANFFP